MKDLIKLILLPAVLSIVVSIPSACEDETTTRYLRYTVMVPPFKNLKGDKDYDYMSMGIADELSRKFAYSNRFDVIDPSFLLKKIELEQLVGSSDNETDVVEEMQKLKAQYAIMGSFNISWNDKILKLKARAVKVADGLVVAEAAEEGEVDHWSYLRGLLAIKIARQIGIPLTDAETAKLKEVETENFSAFRDNYLGRLYYYKSLEARIKKKDDEVKRYRELSMLHYSKAILADLKYQIVRKYYVNTFDFKKLVSSKEGKKDRVQGKLNEMTIFGLKKDDEAEKNIMDWIKNNSTALLSMINGLPDEYRLEVQGHTDTGTPVGKSAVRARQVYEELIKIGIFSEKLSYQGYGAQRRIPWIEPYNVSNNRITLEIKSIIK